MCLNDTTSLFTNDLETSYEKTTTLFVVLFTLVTMIILYLPVFYPTPNMSSVQLVHSTHEGEELIAYMARVSNPTNQDNKDYTKLIRYLIKHKHWSPFEMVSMCVEVKTTRSIAAQILRHRSFSFQEFSQRYSQVETFPVVPNWRGQDDKNRQNSIDNIEPIAKAEFDIKTQFLFDHAWGLYSELLTAGVAKECAREVLPLCTPTKMYMHGTLRSFLHYCDLRCGNGTQKEHRQIADAIKDIIFDEYPCVHEAMWS